MKRSELFWVWKRWLSQESTWLASPRTRVQSPEHTEKGQVQWHVAISPALGRQRRGQGLTTHPIQPNWWSPGPARNFVSEIKVEGRQNGLVGKGTCREIWWSVFDPWNSSKSGRKSPTTKLSIHTCPHAHHAHTQQQWNNYLKIIKIENVWGRHHTLALATHTHVNSTHTYMNTQSPQKNCYHFWDEIKRMR